MTRKEEIIYATLELASEYGLKAVSLSQIADRVGIKKPSLYNHFASKDEIVDAMYELLREKAKQSSGAPADFTTLFENRSLEEILMICLGGYTAFLADKDMLAFFRVLYSERSTSPAAAQLMLEETERMISSTRSLFYALVVHGKMKNDDVDTAALSYAMTVHSLIDKQLDAATAGSGGTAGISEEMKAYVKWFCRHTEVRNDE